jgi:hypothetical protein
MQCPGCAGEGTAVKTTDDRPSRAGICTDANCSVMTFAGNVILTTRPRRTPLRNIAESAEGGPRRA